MTSKNEIVGYNLHYDIVKARRSAFAGPLAGLNARLIHVYPVEAALASGIIRSYLRTQIGFDNTNMTVSQIAKYSINDKETMVIEAG